MELIRAKGEMTLALIVQSVQSMSRDWKLGWGRGNERKPAVLESQVFRCWKKGTLLVYSAGGVRVRSEHSRQIKVYIKSHNLIFV